MAAAWRIRLRVVPQFSSGKNVRSFADDTNLFFSSENLKPLESLMIQELKQIYNYCALNKLSIYNAKTNYMLVSPSRCHPKINIIDLNRKIT